MCPSLIRVQTWLCLAQAGGDIVCSNLDMLSVSNLVTDMSSGEFVSCLFHALSVCPYDIMLYIHFFILFVNCNQIVKRVSV